MKQTLLYVTPHLSTGGMPQYLLKMITSKDIPGDTRICVIEFNDVTGNRYTVQRNQIINISSRFESLNSDGNRLCELIDEINPDIIHFTELPESFLDQVTLDRIFLRKDRNYHIVASTHSSLTNPKGIKYHPDRYIMASQWTKNKFDHAEIGVETVVWEYPIETNFTHRDKDRAVLELGLNQEFKHVLNVGLFTPGKNQAEIFRVAKLLESYPIQFHFVGNQAINFKDYWGPLMEQLPKNCIVWGERKDVDKFYEACDLVYFSSNFELNPISIKEAIGWGLPCLIKRLPPYLDKYDSLPSITYIDNDYRKTASLLVDKLGMRPIYDSDPTNPYMKDTVSIILAHPDTNYRKHLLDKCVTSIETDKILSTNYPVPFKVQTKVTKYFYDQENPLLYQKDYEKYTIKNTYWKDVDGTRQSVDFPFEHSYAVYSLIRNGISIARTGGYEYAFIVNYDYIPSPHLMVKLKHTLETSGCDAVFYRYPGEDKYSTGMFLIRMDKTEYFDRYPSLDSFYDYARRNLYIFENRVFKELNDSGLKIIELDYRDLMMEIQTDLEGFSTHTSRDQKDVPLTRTDVITQFIKKYGYRSYLEIGVFDNRNFKNIDIPIKDSVDPNGNAMYDMTSDKFFRTYPDKKYDVIFIDGLHLSEQVNRDIENSMNALNPGGVILVHDCNPLSEVYQRRNRVTDWWHGDVWKSWIKFLSQYHSEWNGYVIDTDCGIGVIQRGKTSYPISIPDNLTWDWFNENRVDALNLVSSSHFLNTLL